MKGISARILHAKRNGMHASVRDIILQFIHVQDQTD